MVRLAEYVDNFMTTPVPQIDEGSTVKQALDMMRTLNTGILVVTQNGQPAYIVEDWKIEGETMTTKLKAIDQTLREPVHKVRRGTLLASVTEQLGERTAVIIIDDQNKMIGILTASDLWAKKGSPEQQ
jgi:predicted transcriptional regulator